jgi:hypothetical protein
MADPKQLIFQDAEVALPDTYTLPPGLDLSLNSVVAFIDGAGAGGDFRPSLAIYAQSGQLMARVPVDQTFAAGDSGVVTWAPFLRKRGATGPGTSPLTTKGDIYGYDTADARIPVGSDGDFLVADSGEALGVKWQAGGSTPVFEHYTFGSSGYVTDVGGQTQVPLSLVQGGGSDTHLQSDGMGNVELLSAGLFQYFVQATPVGYADDDYFDVIFLLPGTVDGNWFPWVPSGTVRDFRETIIDAGNPRFSGGVALSADPASPVTVEVQAAAFDSSFNNIALSATVRVAWLYLGELA